MNLTDIFSGIASFVNKTNVTSILNIASSGFLYHLILEIILIVLLILLLRFFLSSIIPKFSLLMFILIVSYLLMFVYYLPIYVPSTFVVDHSVNQEVVNTLTSTVALILPTYFYDRLLYYMSLYHVSEVDITIVLFILILYYIYFVHALYHSIGKLSVPVGFMLLIILSLGGIGLFTSIITYPLSLLIFVSVIGISVLAVI